jgi:GLPGLI family protein
MNGYCQSKITEGRIIFKICPKDSIKDDNYDTLKCEEVVNWFKGKKARRDGYKIHNQEVIYIHDGDSNTEIQMETRNGIRIAGVSKNDKGYYGTFTISKYSYKYLNETKTICGYKCYKAEVTNNKDTLKTYVYYTKDINVSRPYYYKDLFKGLKGFPMEWNFYFDGGYATTIVKVIFNEKVDDNVFEVPKDYKVFYVDKKMK